MSTEEHSTTSPLALPAPSENSDAEKLQLNSEQLSSLKFDTLGPMVVNSDGTLSRITNWDKMTELERERTMRVLDTRNKLRLTNEQQKQGSETEGEALGLANT